MLIERVKGFPKKYPFHLSAKTVLFIHKSTRKILYTQYQLGHLCKSGEHEVFKRCYIDIRCQNEAHWFLLICQIIYFEEKKQYWIVAARTLDLKKSWKPLMWYVKKSYHSIIYYNCNILYKPDEIVLYTHCLVIYYIIIISVFVTRALYIKIFILCPYYWITRSCYRDIPNYSDCSLANDEIFLISVTHTHMQTVALSCFV